MTGSHAGNTFSNNKAGAYIKQKPRGTNPQSELQLVRRTTLGQLSKYWANTLSDSQRTAWATFATTYPVISRTGSTIYLSGQQMFCKLNSQLLDSSLSISNTPPSSTAVGTPTGLGVAAVSGSPGTLTVTPTVASAGASDHVWVWISPPLSPGRSFVSSQMRRLAGQINTSGATVVTSDYLLQYGLTPTAAGQRIITRIQVINQDTGITSSMFQSLDNWS